MITTLIETWADYPLHVKICLFLLLIFLVAMIVYAIYDTTEEFKDV